MLQIVVRNVDELLREWYLPRRETVVRRGKFDVLNLRRKNIQFARDVERLWRVRLQVRLHLLHLRGFECRDPHFRLWRVVAVVCPSRRRDAVSGKAFKVLPWQARFVRGAFVQGVQSAALTVGRGNGKTTLLAGIACATLDGPLAMARGETVIVASSFEQARISFEHILAFMGDKLRDKRRWKVWDTCQQARIEDRVTGSRVRCIGSDPRRAHGLAPVLVLADEPAVNGRRRLPRRWSRRCARRRASNRKVALSRSARGQPIRSTGLERC